MQWYIHTTAADTDNPFFSQVQYDTADVRSLGPVKRVYHTNSKAKQYNNVNTDLAGEIYLRLCADLFQVTMSVIYYHSMRVFGFIVIKYSTARTILSHP